MLSFHYVAILFYIVVMLLCVCHCDIIPFNTDEILHLGLCNHVIMLLCYDVLMLLCYCIIVLLRNYV